MWLTKLVRNYMVCHMLKIRMRVIVGLLLLVSICNLVGCRQIWVDTNEIPSIETDDTVKGSSRIIHIEGQDWVDANFARDGFTSSQHGMYGDYATVELTAISQGLETIDFSKAVWSSADNTIAIVQASKGNVATIQGISPGNTTITITADGATQHYQLKVVESTFITFDLSKVHAEPGATSYELELPLINNYTDIATGIHYGNWEILVDWGDGTPAEVLYAEDYDFTQNRYPTHSYALPQEYTIRIINLNEEIGLQCWSFLHASVDVLAYVASGSEDSLANIYVAGDNPNEGPFSHAFRRRFLWRNDFVDVKRYGNGKMGVGMFAWTSAKIFSASGSPRFADHVDWMFYNATYFNEDIGGWDTSKVKSMYGMFHSARSFNQNISRWNVSNVTDMGSMFYCASSFNNGDTSAEDWDAIPANPLTWGEKTSQVENMSWMFGYVTHFKQDISSWNVSNVTDMSYMFYLVGGAYVHDLSGWDVSSVTQCEGFYLNHDNPAYRPNFPEDE